MIKEADLKVTVLQNGNLMYEWWCLRCNTYHDGMECCPYDNEDNDADFYLSST